MKKGQALVEFVIILPIFLFLLLAMIDIGRIMYTKINLENTISDVINLYEDDKSLSDIKTKLNLKMALNIENNDDLTTVYLQKDLDIITPGLNLIFGNPYQIEVKRSILNET